jgi:hypothetical protein
MMAMACQSGSSLARHQSENTMSLLRVTRDVALTLGKHG